jgi:tetratricopeptide (TPR) repeat protein
MWQQAAGRRAAVEAAVAEAGRLRDAYRYAEAQAVLEQAERGADDWARQRLGAALADLRLVQRLDDIRGRAVELTDGRMNWRVADEEYEAAFREAGLGKPGEPAKTVGDRLRGSAVWVALVAAVDDWAARTENEERQAWLLNVARWAERSSEGGPEGWAERFRHPEVWRDRAKLERLAREADVSELSPQTLYALAVALEKQGGDRLPLVLSAQDRHPSDFWLTFYAGLTLCDAKRYGEGEGYYRAARGLRPDSTIALTNLGAALGQQGKLDEAVACYRRALKQDPKYALAHSNLGVALGQQGKLPEAVFCLRRAIELNPKYASPYNNLGIALRKQGKLEEAVACYRRAIDLDPEYAGAYSNLGNALRDKGNLEEAVASHRQAICLDPEYAPAHSNLGIALMKQENVKEAVACFRRALDLNAKDALARTNLRLIELDARLPALLAGTDRPANQAERLEFARLLASKERFGAAADLAAEALAADPRLAADLRAGHRYDAACSAARTGSGQGADAAGLTAGERLRWRRQALTWLRADLAAWDRQLQGGGPAAGPVVRQRLRHWQTDRDLAGLREPAELVRLPAEERAACQRLWADVAALLKRTEPKDKPAAKE